MQNKKFWLLAASLLLVVGCSGKNQNNKLKSPVLVVNDDRNGITWAPVNGATGYEVQVNGGEINTVEEPGYLFEDEEGTYSVNVVAVSAKKRSNASTYLYETKPASVGDLAFDGEKITWSGFVGYSLEYKLNGGEYQEVEGEQVAVATAGLYAFRATAGYDDVGYKFYPQASAEKTIYCTPGAASDFVIEDASAASSAILGEKYEILKYASTAWEPASTAAILKNEAVNEGFTEGACAELKFSHQGYYFMYQTPFSVEDSYGAFGFKVMSDAKINFTLSFQITEHVVLGGIDLAGVYLKYAVTDAPEHWTDYKIRFDDANWRVRYGNNDLTAAEVMGYIALAGYSLNSLADLLPLCDTFQFRVIGTAGTYNTCRIYFDDVKLLKDAPEESEIGAITLPITLGETYLVESAGMKGEMLIQNETTALFRYNQGSDQCGLQATYTVDDDDMILTCNTQGYDFILSLNSPDGGRTLNVVAASGTIAAVFQNFQAVKVYILDDFESWSGQGQGYINSNQRTDNLSGFRKAYYADWNGGDSSYAASILSTANTYRLMGGDGSQVFLKEDVSQSFTGKQVMKLKVNSGAWMRYTTSRVIETISGGAQPAYPHARAFTFMAKGLSAANPFQVRVFKEALITTSNIDSGAVKVTNMSIQPSSNGWVRYTVQLDLAQDYYGWCLAFQNNSTNAGLSSPYFAIDDVALVL